MRIRKQTQRSTSTGPWQSARRRSSRGSDRRGSAVLIVLSLMGMLLMLGIVFYTTASQDRENAQFFLQSEQVAETTDKDYFDFALQQLLLGPKSVRDPSRPYEHIPINSALSGRRHSLIPNALGTDSHPFNGQGVNLNEDPTDSTRIFVDQNYNNVDDLTEGNNFDRNGNFIHDLYEFNDSPVAHGILRRDIRPEPDVDYTYPDINNLFLAYNMVLPDGRRVIIPSFHRPQYLREISPNGVDTDNDGTPDQYWYDYVDQQSGTDTRTRVMRPHPAHTNFDGDDDPTNNVKRYLNQAEAVAVGLNNGFPFRPQNVTGSGFQGRQGVWSATNNSGPHPYEYDVDNDGDNIFEGVWLDLDHPVQETPDGKKFIPLFSFTIYDADALINLNTAGHIPNLTYDFSNSSSKFLSQSAQGLDASEINPQWAMLFNSRGSALPNSADFTAHQFYFNRVPTTEADLANMEWWMMLKGRVYDGGGGIRKVYAGRHGEPTIALQAFTSGDTKLYPQPGITRFDDNTNMFEGGVGYYRYRHPLLWNGVGRYTRITSGTGNPRRPNLVNLPGAGPNNWLQYQGLHVAGDGSFDNTNTYRLGRARWADNPAFANLMQIIDSNALIDEAAESVLLDFHREYFGDEQFGVAEMDLLHLRAADLNDQSAPEARSTRISDLAPFTFSTADSTAHVRQRFTTISNDRRGFGLPSAPQGVNRGWEVTYWDPDGDNGPEVPANVFPPLFGHSNVQNAIGVPPKLAPYSVGGRNMNARFIADVSPFRGPVRRLLGDLRNKLSVNHLVVYSDGRISGEPNRSLPKLRQLTPHPLTVEGDILEVGGDSREPTYNDLVRTPNDIDEDDFNRVQEYWARVDRQALCRDIYVLLYTFGGGDSSIDYTRVSNSNEQIYTDEQLAEMAQFAVNLVDAADTDNVMTQFEYDIDLSDGWNLGDRPWITGDDPDAAQRRLVTGVEAQTLTLSEALTLTAQQVTGPGGIPQDHGATEWDDQQDNFFHYLELQNLTPFDVNLQNFQFRFAPAQNPPVPGTERRMSFVGQQYSVAAGGVFTMGATKDPNVKEKVSQNGGPDQVGDPYSQMKVDENYQTGDNVVFSQLQPIAPSQGTLDLDIVQELYRDTSVYNNQFVFERAGNNQNDPGEPLTQNDGTSLDTIQWLSTMNSTVTDIDISIWRRLNPNMVAPSPTNAVEYKQFERINPWVRVDFMTYNPQILALKASDQSTELQMELPKLRSFERREALNRASKQEFNQQNVRANTLTQQNSQTNTFSLWHAHFDRELGSIGELLNIPLFSPGQLTNQYSQLNDRLSLGLAFGKFFGTQEPDNQNGGGGGTGNPRTPGTGNAYNATATRDLGFGRLSPSPGGSEKLDNLWYRLFSFVEVPPRTNRQIEDNLLEIRRTAGKINLNTVRHREVLAGLIDDIELVDLYTAQNGNRGLLDRLGEQQRDWWMEFLKSRDGEVNSGGARLPGTPAARPFRDFSYARLGIDSVEDTLFRSLPVENNLTGRRLFEVGTNADQTGNKSNVTHWLRHQTLSKMMNNVTTRSNTFIVFASVKLFEVHEEVRTVQYGNTQSEVRYPQIGGPFHPKGELHDSDLRAMFIIDRSRLEDALDQASARQITETGRMLQPGDEFDWKNFVMHRLLIEDNLR